MPRLNEQQWELARADYEVRGLSLGEVGRRHGVSQPAVAKMARKMGWERGKSLGVVERKVAAIKNFALAEEEKFGLPKTFQVTIDDVVRERLQADGIHARLDVAIAHKGLEMVRSATSLEDLEMLSRISKNIRPQQTPQTTVNVQQAQVQPPVKRLSPEEICKSLIEEQKLEIEAEERAKLQLEGQKSE